MTREECEKAIELIDDYVNGCASKEEPTKGEVNEAILVIDELITKHFELVDHTTPKKVVWIYDDEPLCPSCREAIDAGDQDLCEFCQQRLNWEENDE